MTRPAHSLRHPKAFAEAQLTPARVADISVAWLTSLSRGQPGKAGL